MVIDLRSDTVSRPSQEMREAMAAAPVGDDVFGDDPTVNTLQSRVAEMFGMEKALFFPSGTMANQVAIQCHVQPGEEVICDQFAHVYKYEGGGIAANAGASVRLLQGVRGMFKAQDVLENINADDVHFPKSRLVCLENTMNRGGGACWPNEQIAEVSKAARHSGLGIHLDGARLWNAMVATNTDAGFYGQHFDSISVCFSKGLGCPVGSVLVGTNAFITKAHRLRKRFGGGMRQVGFLAAACNFALDHHIERLADDHNHALETAQILKQQSWVVGMVPVETNILLFDTGSDEKAQNILTKLREKDVWATATGKGWIRFTFHLDITERHMAALKKALTVIG